MHMNQKGQAFSVFQLLIAAIIALAILVFLLQIIGQLPGFGQVDPTEEAATKLKTASSRIGTPEITNRVTFEANKPLSARTIASKTNQLSAGEICVTRGASETERFQVTSGSQGSGEPYNILTYTGSQKIERRLYILCDIEREITQTKNDLSAAIPDSEDALANFDDDCQPQDSSNKYCVVSVIAAGS